MSLHVYYCHLPARNVGMSYEPPDPGEYFSPCGMYVAETRGRAKLMLLAKFYNCTYSDEFTEVRTNCVARHVDDILEVDDGSYVTPAKEGPLLQPRVDPPLNGPLPPSMAPRDRLYYECWARVHEIEHHGGAKCDCPELEWDNKTQDWKEVAA